MYIYIRACRSIYKCMYAYGKGMEKSRWDWPSPYKHTWSIVLGLPQESRKKETVNKKEIALKPNIYIEQIK